MSPEFVVVCFSLSIAAIVVSAVVYALGSRWLQDRAATRIQENVLGEVTARLDNSEAITKKLAEDWRAKFGQLEQDWKKLKEHAESQYAGAVAQSQTRGWGR
jgi:hypothetical protein